MNPSSRTRRAKQTRLTFTPLPSSSPASKKIEKEHGKRTYATVGLEGGKRKRGKIEKVEEEDGDEITTLPTPERSSHPRPLNHSKPTIKPRASLEPSRSSSESDILPSAKRRRVARQRTLDFTNHIGGKAMISDEEETFDEMARPGSSGRLRGGLFGTQHKLQELVGSEESSEDELLSNRRSTKTQAKSSPIKRTRATKEGNLSRSSPLARTTRSSKKTCVELSSSGSEGEVVKEGRSNRAASILDFGEPETSGDNVPALRSSTTKRRPRATQKPEIYVELSTSEDDMPVSTRKKPKTKSPTVFSRKNKRAETKSEEEDDLEEESPAPVRRRLKQRPRELDEQEQEDLNEDLDFLRSSPPAITPSARARKLDPRKEALEALKRKRAGQSAAPSSSAALLRRDMQTIAISDDEEEDDDDDDVSSVDEWQEETAPLRGARGVFREDDEDRAFIAEDDPNEPLGAPPDVDAEMPLWASNFSRMKGKELFKYAVEWMVQKKLNPAFKMDDEVYDLAFKKLDDEVRGLAGSKFKSSVWARDFMVSLEGRPEVILTEAEGLDRELLLEKCQACNRSGHPATFDIQFTGRPYHMSTLEPVEDDDGEDEEEEGEDTDILGKYDSRDRDLPPASRIYHVGRFCKDNAITAHALEHWRFHLFEWVVVELEKGKHLRPSKIVERDSWSTKKRREYANKVVDGMGESGQIKKLYRDFRIEIDMAREKKTGWRGRSGFV